jgi:hypothetical protein
MKKILIFLILICANFIFAQELKDVNKVDTTSLKPETKVEEVKTEEIKEEKKYESSLFKLEKNEKILHGVKNFIKDDSLKIPTNFKAIDVENDGGGVILLSWNYPMKDKGEFFEVLRKEKKEKKFKKIASIQPSKDDKYDYRDSTVKDHLIYSYKIVVKKDGKFNETSEKTLQSQVAIFDANKTVVLVAAIFLTFAIVFFIRIAKSGKTLYIRRIAGLDAVDDAVGRATEMGREIMFVPGIGDIDDPQTIAGLTILGRVAKLTAQYKTPLSVPVSRSMVMVTGREIVKESYLSMGRPENFQSSMVYYLTDDQFGFAAGVDGIMVREKPATIFLQGSFFAESLILAETGHHVGAIQISGTAAPSQLPFFITACDYTLMGEELYAASAYLSREPQLLGSLRGQDAGKALILVAIIVGIILETIAAINPSLHWLSIKHYFHIK